MLSQGFKPSKTLLLRSYSILNKLSHLLYSFSPSLRIGLGGEILTLFFGGGKRLGVPKLSSSDRVKSSSERGLLRLTLLPANQFLLRSTCSFSFFRLFVFQEWIFFEQCHVVVIILRFRFCGSVSSWSLLRFSALGISEHFHYVHVSSFSVVLICRQFVGDSWKRFLPFDSCNFLTFLSRNIFLHTFHVTLRNPNCF